MVLNRKRISLLEEWIDGSSVHRESDDVGEENTEAFAWVLYQQTLHLFAGLLPFAPDDDGSQQHKKTLKDALGKLFLWGDGFSGGRLEVVLEECDDLKVSIISGLAAIGRTLNSQLVWNTSGSDIQQQIPELEILLEKAKFLLIDSDEGENESDSDVRIVENRDPLVQRGKASASLQISVSCLMDLIPSMTRTLNMAQQELFQNSNSNSPEFTVSGPAQTYVRMVSDRFPKADTRLVQRMGEANWQRHIALRKVPTVEAQALLQEEPEVEGLPKAWFVPVSMFHDSGLGSSKTASKYEATMALCSSLLSSNTVQEDEALRVPRTPKEVIEGKPFKCDICGHMLHNIKDRINWKRHVFFDLQPYICTFSGCPQELRTFPTRKLWRDHEVGHHIKLSWACLKCPQFFLTTDYWRTHLKESHRTNMTDQQLQVAIRVAERKTPRPLQNESCPLCQEVPGKSNRHFLNHVAGHMEDISLAVLPKDGSEPDPEDDSKVPDHDVVTTAGPSASSYRPATPQSPSRKKHKCHYCDAEFIRMPNLRGHLLTHSPEMRMMERRERMKEKESEKAVKK